MHKVYDRDKKIRVQARSHDAVKRSRQGADHRIPNAHVL